MGSITPEIQGLVQKAQILAGSIDARISDGKIFTVEEFLRGSQSSDEDPEMNDQITTLLDQFKSYYKRSVPPDEDGNTQVIIQDTQASAYMTLIPARSGSTHADTDEVLRQIAAAGIREGIMQSAVEAAAKACQGNEMIWSLPIASAQIPTTVFSPDGAVP